VAADLTCPACGGTDFEDGFVDDTSVGNGRVRWVAGRFRVNMFGGAKGRGIGRGRPVLAYRCQACDRLELYVGEHPDGPWVEGP
jgi:hypothetical protein